MARVPLTEAIFKNGTIFGPARGTEVYVYERGTESKATLYSAESGGGTLDQPLITDAGGRPEKNGLIAWLAPGRYDLFVNGKAFPWGNGEEGGGAEGPEGPPGPEGPTGPKGDTGAMGAAGTNGAPGAEGPEGLEGPQGPKGEDGEEGEPGELGPKGDTGAEGPQGEKGAKGDTGSTGAEGPEGPEGPQGVKGDAGAKGDAGEKGAKGDTGSAGSEGPEGPAGEDGESEKSLQEHTFAIPGTITTASAEGLRHFIGVLSGQTVRLVRMRAQISSGTSATCKLQINGSDATGFTALEAKTTAAQKEPTAVSLANNDAISLVVTAVSGTPKNLSVTFMVEKSR